MIAHNHSDSDSRGISYVDDVTWVVEGTDVDDVVSKLERCAQASSDWADNNAVRFEESKTGDSALESAEASTVSSGDQGGEHTPGEVRERGDTVDRRAHV